MSRHFLKSPNPLSAAVALLAVVVLSGCGRPAQPVLALEEQLAEARMLLDSFNFTEAHTLYRVVYPELPVEDPHWPEAAFGHASALWHMAPSTRANIEAAEAVFTRITAALPGTDWAAAARLAQARIRMLRDFPGDAEDPAAAIPILAALVRDAQGYLQHEAVLRLAECHRMDFGNPASLQAARALLRDWLARHPDNPLAASMWEQLAWLNLWHFRDNRAALDAFIAAERFGFADPTRVGALLWRIATLCEETGDPASAAHYYAKVMTEAPASGRAFEALRALERLRASVPGLEHIEVPALDLVPHS